MNKIAMPLRVLGAIALVLLMTACQGVDDKPLQPEVVKPEPVAAESAPTQAPPKPVDPAESMYKLAMWSAKAGKLEDAIDQFSQVVDINPAYKNAYTNLGLLLLQNGDFHAARDALQSAIEQDKSDAIAYNHLAIVQRNAGDFQQALENYRKAIEANPDYANAHLNLGILLDIYIQDLPGALQHYETFLQLTGGNNEQIDKWVIDIKRRIEKLDNNKG